MWCFTAFQCLKASDSRFSLYFWKTAHNQPGWHFLRPKNELSRLKSHTESLLDKNTTLHLFPKLILIYFISLANFDIVSLSHISLIFFKLDFHHFLLSSFPLPPILLSTKMLPMYFYFLHEKCKRLSLLLFLIVLMLLETDSMIL